MVHLDVDLVVQGGQHEDESIIIGRKNIYNTCKFYVMTKSSNNYEISS